MKPFKYKSYSRDDIRIRYSDYAGKKEHLRVTHAFLQSLMKEFAVLSRMSFKPKIGANNLAYMYSERRLDSVVLPALSHICGGVVLTELPVQRKKANYHVKTKHGRLDYWCVYRGYTFVIEMKGSHDKFEMDWYREDSAMQQWEKMIAQLKDVKAECEKMTENTKGVIRLGLHFISSWADKEPAEEMVEHYRKNVQGYLQAFCGQVAERFGDEPDYLPTYAAAWVIPDEMVYHWLDVTYPGVMLFAKAFEPVPHKVTQP